MGEGTGNGGGGGGSSGCLEAMGETLVLALLVGGEHGCELSGGLVPATLAPAAYVGDCTGTSVSSLSSQGGGGSGGSGGGAGAGGRGDVYARAANRFRIFGEK